MKTCRKCYGIVVVVFSCVYRARKREVSQPNLA